MVLKTPFTQKHDTKLKPVNTVAFDLRRNHSAATAVTVIACYYCGRYGISLLVPVGLVLYLLKYMWRTALRAKPFQVPDINEDSPQFMNYESTRWLCMIIGKIWALLDPTIIQTLIDVIEDSLQGQLPPFLNSIGVVDFDLGKNAPTIANVFANRSNQSDSLFLEFDIALPPLPIGQTESSSNPTIILELSIAKKILPQLVVRVVIDNITLRGRLQMHVEFTGEAPFLQTGYISFQKAPQIDFSIKPMGLIDFMELPGLSDFVLSSINLAIEDLIVMPNWYKLDLAKLLSGDDMPDSIYQSLMVVHFQRLMLNETSKSLLNSMRPYLTVSSEMNNRILSRTRVFKQCENINAFETVLINKDDVKMDKRLRIGLWSEDKFTPDDLHAWSMLSVKDLVKKHGIVYDGTLDMTNDRNNVKAKLQCKISMHHPTSKFTPELDSAVLIIQLFQAKDLTVPASFLNLTRDYLNPYAAIKLNGGELYRTRTKLHNCHPFWNATHETLLRDWREAQILVQVFDKRDYEFDVCIGDAVLNLNEMVETLVRDGGMFRGWRDLIGTGAGKIRVNLRLISLGIKIPRSLRGLDRGTLTIFSAYCDNWSPLEEEHHRTNQYRLRLVVHSFEPQHAEYKSEMARSHNKSQLFWNELNMDIPLKERQHTVLRIHIEPAYKLLHRHELATTSFDLQQLIDNELMMIRLPLNNERAPTVTIIPSEEPHDQEVVQSLEPLQSNEINYPLTNGVTNHISSKEIVDRHSEDSTVKSSNGDSLPSDYTEKYVNGTSSQSLIRIIPIKKIHKDIDSYLVMKALFVPELITDEQQQEREQIAFSKTSKQSSLKQVKAVRVARFVSSKAKENVKRAVLDKRFIKRTTAQNVPLSQKE